MATDPGQESPVRALLRMTPPRDEGARFLFPRIAVVDLPVVDQSVTAALSRQFFIRGDYLLIPFFGFFGRAARGCLGPGGTTSSAEEAPTGSFEVFKVYIRD